MVKFTKEKDELLIELVKGHNILYDASNENFKNAILKHKSWEEISAIIAVPVPECKKRWKCLRDQYNKKKKTEFTGTERCISTMNLLSFLSDTIEKRAIVNCDDSLQEVVVEVKDETEDEELEGNDEEISEQYIKNEVTQEDPLNTEESAHNRNKRTLIKRRFTGPIRKNMAKRRQRSVLYEKRINKTPTEKFFESMADIVDRLPTHLQAEVRLKVCQIVTEAELKYHKEHTLYPNLQSQSYDQYSNTGEFSNISSTENAVNTNNLVQSPMQCMKFELE